MNPQGTPTGQEDFLTREVGESANTNDGIKNSTLALLEETARICERTDPETAAAIRQDCEEVRLETINALMSVRGETQQGIAKIRSEVELTSLQKQNLSDGEIDQEEYARIQEEFEDIEKYGKSVDDLSNSEAQDILRFTQLSYTNFERQELNLIQQGIISLTNSAIGLDSQQSVNVLQEKLIDKIYGPELREQGFDTRYLSAFNDEEGGNRVIEIAEFERQLKNESPENWNSLALVNYFKLLDSQGGFDLGTLIEKLGATQIIALGELWKTQPNGPAMTYFQENKELKWIVDGATNIDFQSMLFEEDIASMQQVSQLFDAASEEDRNIIQEQIHGLLYDSLYNNNIDQLRHIADRENIGEMNEGMYRFTVESARKMVLAHETISSLEAMYLGGPDVGGIVRALILSSVNDVGLGENGEVLFSFDGVNEIIGAYNNENNSAYPLVGGEFTDYLGQIFNSSALIGEYSESISRLSEINDRISEIQSQLQNPNIRPEEKDDLRSELYGLYRQQTGVSQQVSAQEGNLEDNFQEQAEYQRLIMSFTGSSIHIDISQDVHRNFILADPASRLILLSSAEDFVTLLPEIDRRDIDISDINPDFLTNPEILRFIVSGDFRTNDFFRLPEEVYQNQDLCSILGDGKSNEWNTLFYKILLTHGAQESVGFIYQLIFENPEIFRGEEDIEKLQKAIPYTIRNADSENLLQEIPIHVPSITTSAGFNESVVSYIDYINSEAYTQEQEIDTGEGAERRSVSWAESLNEYIRNYGVSSEVHTSIQQLIQAGRINDMRLILTSLHPENEGELGLIMSALEGYEVNYHFLSPQAQSHPSVIQKMGEFGISSFQTVLIKNITSQKLLAQYLIGFTSRDENNVRELRNHPDMELLRNSIDPNISSELTTEEVGALEKFYQRRLIIGEMIDSLEGSLENINEAQRNQISEILEREGVIGMELPENFQDLDEIDAFLANAGERLEAIGKTDDEIQAIIQEILNINTQSARERVIVTDREGVTITPSMRGVLEQRGFLLPGSTPENPNINYDGLVEQYLESYRNENISESDLDSPEIIHSYLLSMGLSSEEANSIIANLQTRIQYEIQRRGEENYPSRNGLENPPGLYGGTQERMLTEIANGEYNYTPFENGGIPESSALPENWEVSNLSPDFQSRLKQDGNDFFLLSGGKEIPLSREEVSIIYNNPEAEKNLIDAYQIFSNEGLERIWEHKDAMMQAIGNHDTSGITFNLRDGNYIDQREMNYLLSTILYVTTENETYQNVGLRSLEDTISQVRRETQGAFGEENTRNIGQGENKLEKSFIDKYTMRNQGDEGMFNYTAFSKALKGDFSPNPQ